MTKIKELFKTYFSDTKKIIEIIGTLGFTMIFLGVILSPIVSFAGLEPVKSITISSENLSYENNEPGSWQITKSAKWISKGKAQITFELDTLVKTNNIDTDVILVLDTSGSMSGERIDKVKKDTTSLISNILSNENNSIALITFGTTSKIINNFTQDKDILIESINNLEAIGNTNYYQALVNVDIILKNYTWEENKDCVVLFLTDGYPNEDSPNEIAQYNYLKTTYPYLTINSIQYEMGEEDIPILKSISDNQYNANIDNLEKYLYRASMSPIKYENFQITDYIDNLYFTIADSSSININAGTYTLENNKITWNLDKINSGSSHKMTIDITLNDGLYGLGEVFPTNEQTQVTSLIDTIEENIIITETPRITDTYKIIYEENTPDNCIVSNMPQSTTASIFDTVEITTEEPTCEGYQFKKWQIVNETLEIVNNKNFIMPEEDVTIRATWSRLSSNKSMDGKVSVVQNLYQMMADNSVPDNIKSEYVTSTTGIDFGLTSSDTNGKGIYQAVKLEGEDTPIYYYRGDINNNNLIFANFCWKIVRTTETGGVKLIYNGIPNEDGSCTATGENSYIGKSTFNNSDNSIAYNGYMYKDVYPTKSTFLSIIGIGGKSQKLINQAENTNYIYASDVIYNQETGFYTLVNGQNKIWNDTYSVDTGNQYLYTCLSETETTCQTVNFITQSTSSTSIYYTSFTGGELASDIMDKEIVYGNDISYSSETGTYTLENTFTSKIDSWITDSATISGPNGYHYTCFTESQTCEKIVYIYSIHQVPERGIGIIYYIELENGVTIEEALKNMTTESDLEINSTIKQKLDTWYELNMLEYTTSLEDTIWCNDMSITNYSGWQKDNKAESYLNYSVQYRTPTTKCKIKNNSYTVSDLENGNGALEYPVGLLTYDELRFAGNEKYNENYYLFTGSHWWTMSPKHYRDLGMAYGYHEHLSWDNSVSTSSGIRPSISLKPNTRSIDGDGSPEDPFIVG